MLLDSMDAKPTAAQSVGSHLGLLNERRPPQQRNVKLLMGAANSLQSSIDIERHLIIAEGVGKRKLVDAHRMKLDIRLDPELVS